MKSRTKAKAKRTPVKPRKRTAPKKAPEPTVLDELLLHADDDFSIEVSAWIWGSTVPTYEKMNQAQRTLHCWADLELEVCNGGLRQFFTNSPGNHAIETAASMRRLGSAKLAKQVEKANALFGKKGPPIDREKRTAVVDTWDDETTQLLEGFDEAFYATQTSVWPLMRKYIKANKRQLLENTRSR